MLGNKLLMAANRAVEMTISPALAGETSVILDKDTPFAASAASTYTNDDNRTGSYYTITFSRSCVVQIKLWGAGGAGDPFQVANTGGAGGCAVSDVTVVGGTTYQLLIGQPGWSGTQAALSGTGGWGGGGSCQTTSLTGFAAQSTAYGAAPAATAHTRNAIGGGGGGASGFFLSSVAVGNEILIAGGGGGGGYAAGEGGAGGGTNGQDGVDSTVTSGTGGTQSAGGTCPAGATGDGGAGYGGPGEGRGGGGGSGYYGGGGGEDNTNAGGGGGSGYYNPTYCSNATLYTGDRQTPGNDADSDRDGAAAGGVSQTYDTYGGPGRFVIYLVS